MPTKKALIVWGGWDGHEPRQCSELFAGVLAREGFEVEVSTSLEAFADKDKMQTVSLVVPVWTMGQLGPAQEAGLLEAVKSGVGLAGFHGGMGDAFRASLGYQFMTGSQFMAHPGGCVEYEVNIVRKRDPIVKGIKDFKIKSEQYYMHTDPGNEVLATTTFTDGYDHPWTQGTVMPTIWKKRWGQGRVFYSALGHVAREFTEYPDMLEITRRGMLWAAR